jgi:tetratricopeptide (TPR) repeat protein
MFCPDSVALTLQSNREVIVPPSHLPNRPGLFGDVQHLPTCELPPPRNSSASDLPSVPAQPAGEKADILDTLGQAATMVRAGNASEAAVEYQRIASDYPEAAWARGFIRNTTSSAGSPGGKTYALLIGISKYPPEQKVQSLQFARADAQTFADFLITPRGGAVPGDQIEMLLDGKATRDGIDSAVKTFVDKAASDKNTLILFVASHGVLPSVESDPKTGKTIMKQPYLVTVDSYNQDPKTTGYPMADFHKLIAAETYRFGRVIVYVDACYASLIRDAPIEKSLEVAEKEVFSDQHGSVGVMLASTKDAYEAAAFGGHGAFTYSVLKGLNGGAVRGNSTFITFNDLYRYVLDEVGDLTNNAQSPDRFLNNDKMLVLDDTTKGPGISLPEATPLPEAATRRRGRLQNPESNSPEQPTDTPQRPGFSEMANADPLAAIPEYQRIAADTSVSEDDRKQAAETLRVALEEHGQQILIRYLHGEQMAPQKDEFDLGGRYFEEAVRLPRATAFDESRMWFCKGRSRIFEKKYGDAVEMLERSIALDPDHAYAYNALGIAYLEQVPKQPELYGKAVAAFHDALRFAPNWAYPMHNMALAYSEQGRFADAQGAYQAAMRLAPKYSYLPYNLGLLYQRMNRFDDAERMYRLALQDAEDNRESGLVPPVSPWKERADIRNALGSVAAVRKRKAAKDLYEAALNDDPQLPAAKYNLAIWLSRNGPSQRAVDLWRENIAAHPDEPASRLALAAYLERQKDRSGAIREYEGAVAVAGQNVAARRALAQLYAEEGRWQDAYDQLKQARALSPEHAGITEEFGDAAMKVGQNAEAIEAYGMAEKLFTGSGDRKRLAEKLKLAGRS